ncbi:ABC transporter ATP-binding protein [Streptomyces caniscabiei]|uniref:ABC transporter ATP-binding protein n=1 Tax=Streptomyces caniscabiei TaxID=2746961 RepID=UPI0029B07BA5|nr:ABC transporter ATP-binding protein [Streptomyces caniscabiei]MDX2776670.1 ABC transporter ATP-binding protein [Streptomyces caniscabiei]
MNAVTVRDVSVTIGHKRILEDISAAIPTGKIVGLLGPSGAGKTTLIRTILGLQPVSSGKVDVLGGHPGGIVLRAEVGYVTQAPSVYADLTVKENIQYFASLLGLPKSAVRQVIADVELLDHERQLVGSLSGGQKTRVSLAIALLGQPKLLVLDEPTVGLDPVLREKIWHIFETLAARGVTLLVTSHVMDEADRCDELLFIRDGKLLAAGTRPAILEKTKARTMEAAFLKLATEQESES